VTNPTQFADELCDLMEDLDALIEAGLVAVQYHGDVRRYGITPKARVGLALLGGGGCSDDEPC
jgi:hypothetical protein